MSANELNVLVTKDGSKPYAENSAGDILSTFNKAVLGQLLLTTTSFELQAGLLKQWFWDSKSGSYELTLREDLKFHDNTPVTSADLEFALLRGFFSKQRSFYSIYLGNILGIDKIQPDTKYKSGLVEGVSITGPHSVRVKLRDPNPSFLYSITRPYFSLAKQSALNEDFVTWKKWPIGAGSYKVTNEDENKVTLEKVRTTDKGVQKILLYKQFLPDISYDISFFNVPQNLKIYATKDPSAIFTLFFTNQNELSKNSDFRNALKFGTDRKELIRDDEFSKPSFEFLPSSFWKNDSTIQTEYNLAKAKSYFSKIPTNLKNKVWKIPFFSFGEMSPDKIRVAKILQAQYLKFGFKIEYYPSSEKFLSKESATKSPLSFAGRICNNVDPLLMFSSFQTNSPQKYDNSQNDPNYDSLFQRAAKAVTTIDRIKTLKVLSQYTVNHNFMIPLYENAQLYYYNPLSISDFGNQNNSITLFLDEIVMK